MAVAAAILDLEARMIPKLYSYDSSGLVMPEIVQNDIIFVLIALLVLYLSHFIIFKMAMAAILDLEVRMIPKLYNNHSSGFVTPEIVEKDISFVRLGYLYVFQDGVGGHFEYYAIKKVPITFQRFIGANFLFKWFLKSNPSRKKGSKKMVTESQDMTLL